jgi:carboxypeptidase Q
LWLLLSRKTTQTLRNLFIFFFFFFGEVFVVGTNLPTMHSFFITRNLIKQRALANTNAEKLMYICDTFGPRPSGSAALNAASEYVLNSWRAEGLPNVRAEGGFNIPTWVRGNEFVEMVTPVRRRLTMIGLGHALGGDVTAEVVSAQSELEFEQIGLSGGFVGKIAFLNVEFTTYGDTVPFRSSGPGRVSNFGGVGCIIRSVTPYSLQTPHTGLTDYGSATPIPAAAGYTRRAGLTP